MTAAANRLNKAISSGVSSSSRSSRSAVGFGACKCLVDRFEFAESFGHSDGGFTRVCRSGHKCDACRHSRFELDAPAQAEDRIEHRAGGPR